MSVRGVVVGYRRSGARQDTRHVIIRVDGVNPGKLVSSIVEVVVKGRVYRGRILKPHGKHAVIARFYRNLPGQAIGATAVFKALS